jgi:hypothetical protein
MTKSQFIGSALLILIMGGCVSPYLYMDNDNVKNDSPKVKEHDHGKHVKHDTPTKTFTKYAVGSKVKDNAGDVWKVTGSQVHAGQLYYAVKRSAKNMSISQSAVHHSQLTMIKP